MTPLWFDLRRLSAQGLLDYFGLDKPPIDVFDLAKRMGVGVYVERDMALSGRLVSSAGPPPTASIFVNVHEPPKRQRFTVAHEIGHLMKHDVGTLWRDTNYRGDAATERMEREANNFAAALLMPAHLVELYAEATTDPGKLSAVFQVGREAMNYRVLNVLHGIR